MYKNLIFLVLTFIVFSCKHNIKYTNPQEANVQFEKYKSQFIEDLWKQYPAWATSVGFHKYDSVLIVPNAKSRAEELNFIRTQFEHLTEYPVDVLNPDNRIDYYMIRDWLSSTRWNIQTFKSFKSDP